MKNNINPALKINRFLQADTNRNSPAQDRDSVFSSSAYRDAVAAASIPALWEHFELTGEPCISCHSPFREDRDPSFSVYQKDSGAWRFKDFARPDVKGDAYQFFILATGKEKSAASAEDFIKIVASLPEHEASSRHSHEDWPSSPPHPGAAGFPDFSSMAAKFSSNLSNDNGVIERHATALGVQVSTIGRLAEEGVLGYSPELGGLTIHTARGVFVRRDVGKRQNLKGSKQDLWRECAAHDAERVILTEGASDAIAALDAGLEDDGTMAVVALPSATTSFQEPGIEALRGKDVILVPDRDEAGRRVMEKAKKCLLPIVRSLTIFSWDAVFNRHPNLNNDVKDLRDLHANLGPNVIAGLLMTCSTPAQPESDGLSSSSCGSTTDDEAPREPLSSSFPDVLNKVVDPGGELIQHGFLRQGQSMAIVAPSGSGKSSLTIQLGVSFSLGWECLGLRPARALTVMLIQSENDDVDQLEVSSGVLNGLRLTQDHIEFLRERCFLHECQESGGEFLDGRLQNLIHERNPDLVILDPYGDFQDDTALNEQKVKAFLVKLRGIIKNARCGCILVHHTPKPSKERSSSGPYDEQYLGYGTSLLSNHVRGILILKAMNSRGFFEMKAAKRGERLQWTDEKGERTLSKFIRHADRGEGIYWQLATAAEVAAERGKELGSDGSRKKGAEDVLRFLQAHEEAVEKSVVAAHLNSDPGKLGINPAKDLLKRMVQDGAIHEHDIPRKGRRPAIGLSLSPFCESDPAAGENAHGRDDDDVNASS